MALIERVELMMVDLAPKVSRVDAIQSFVSQETPIVRLTDADGATGLGYSYTIGTGGLAVMSLLKTCLAPRLIGTDADMVEAIWRDLLFATHATQPGAITSLALAAVDTALWDLRCRRAGVPLHKLAGGAQSSVPIYTTEGGWLHLPTDVLVQDAIEAKDLGFKGVKLKVGKPSPSEDHERLNAVRDAVGDQFEIMVDANQSFRLDDAIRRARQLEALNIAWLEEPLPADDVAGHARLAAGTSVPIAVGESLYSIGQFRDYLAQNACSIVQVDVARIGGITPWLKVAHMAEAANLAVAPHFLMELHVSLACAVPNARWVEHIPQLDLVTSASLSIEQGRAHPPQASGLGIAWDMAQLDRLSIPEARADISTRELS